MVEYLDGGRIQGSSTLTSSPPATSWKELGRTTLSSAGDSIDVSSFAAKDNLMILCSGNGTTAGQGHPRLRLGNSGIDTGTNYADRHSNNGSSDSTDTSQSFVYVSESDIDHNCLITTFINNISNREKLIINHSVRQASTGAGNTPSRFESVGKWANTSNAITDVEIIGHHTASYDFASGSELVVLGCDNDEADSGTNFWQELADVELTSSSTTIDSGTFTAKKYLWIQFYGNQSTGSSDSLLRFNSDSGSNYARRFSTNGGTDSTSISATSISNMAGSECNRDPFYSNIFIINKSDKEKLVIGELIFAETGAGAGNATARREWVAKWANTSAQITQSVLTSSSNYDTGSYIKVWGSD